MIGRYNLTELIKMEKERLSILVIDPDRSDHQLIRESLQRSKVPACCRFVTSTARGLNHITRKAFDLILTDHALPAANAFHLLFELQQRGLPIPVLLLTRNGEARIAREAFHRGVDDFLLKEELESVSLFDIIGNLIEKRREREEQIKKESQLKELAERDGLTGLFNHRYFLDAIEREFERARRYRRDLSLVMIDLDGFKSINDTCGHPQGNQVLVQISRLLLQTLRFVDVVSRYGGDEFAILLPETNLISAQHIASRILHEIRRSPFLYEERVFPLSASVGIAPYHPSLDSPGTLIKEADQALYEAKRSGRDRIAIAGGRASGRRSPSAVSGEPLACQMGGRGESGITPR